MNLTDQQKMGLHSKIIDGIEAVLSETEARKMGVIFNCGLRTADEQNKLYALGRTTKNPDGCCEQKQLGNIVTKAMAYESWHNYGLAVDLCFVNSHGDKFWPLDDDSKWLELGKLGIAFGFVWGGSWKFQDRPHFEMTGKFFGDVHKAKVILESEGINKVWELI